MEQLGFDLAEQAANAAAAHADRVHADWSDKAFAAFRAYASENQEFTTEDIIKASPSVPTPPDKRAWGQVARRAVRENVCISFGIGRSRLPHAHGRMITVWRSRLFTAVPA